ncbi:MAG: protein-glutamate O-methyltransferase [Cytophagales bacterium]|nr:protein-glutamate O-methyltransferase [Cytophagales bacterium]
MADADFKRLSAFIFRETGIKLSPAKKSMLEGRLQRRLKALEMSSFRAYCDFLFSPDGHPERVPMIDLVTTNKTDFFREPAHFSFLQARVLAELTRGAGNRPLKCWSAGCSSGEEPYTLAMVLSEYAEHHPLPPYSVLATDLSTEVLALAVRAVYPEGRAADIPLPLRQKYLLKSKNRSDQTVRIAPAIRQKVQFNRLNFMQDHYDVPPDFSLIFCRNVLIYFDKPTQEAVINKLCRHLHRGGYLFLGHSESITDMDVPLEQIRPTVFRKMDG